MKKSPKALKVFLNVGGNNKEIQVPKIFNGWEHILLDIDATNNPDIIADARDLFNLAEGQFDAVYCAHTLEHFYRHEVPKVLSGFKHVLREDGFIYLYVPNIREVMKRVIEGNLSLDATLYFSAVGPIQPLDVIYGHHQAIEYGDNHWFAHKTGFDVEILTNCLAPHFKYGHIKEDSLGIIALASNKEMELEIICEA